MAHRQPGLSRTLPKDFTFNAAELNDPQTPKQLAVEPKIPPPPHHSTCRFQRPRINIFAEPNREYLGIGSPDVPLPSIEFPQESAPKRWCSSHEELTPSNRLRVPAIGRCAPKTPPAQIRTTPSDLENSNWTTERIQEYGNSIPRPLSACSNASDSSVSSSGTFDSRPSFGGSCTSPESDIQDPFITHTESSRKQLLKSPSKPGKSSRRSLGTKTECRWTPEMDNHLWNTYQIYLQDPTITPFKMVPGSIPPLGVSHRVAREARRTWPKTKTASFQFKLTRRQFGDSLSVRNERPIAMGSYRSGSATPTAGIDSFKPTWPRSESSTRRRLKELCKRKFSIAPHYQRLLQSRSPSPFHDLFPRRTSRASSRLGSSYSNSTSFATRDLGVSLVSSSARHQLSQLATEETPRVETEQDWFNNPVETSNQQAETTAPQTSKSGGLGDPGPVPRLGSPFMYNTWGPSTSNRRVRPTTPINQCDTIHVTGSRLRSPARMDLLSNAPKRRALRKFDDEPGPDARGIQRNIQELFRGNEAKDVSRRRVRLRNRGATVGGIVGSRARLEQLFTPPSPAVGLGHSSDDAQATNAETNKLSVPEGDGIKRLASPFKINGPKPLVASPRHTPSLSDPFSCNPTDEQDVATTPTHQGHKSRETRTSSKGKPYNVAEEGISDAERIRRQLLNRSFP
ncbi:hypothetical protein FQN54_006793 [Arachnomyces sp. PD_36]|nr:hypothetical protein FQN54_006793 [Arachnomyces sp. PD_36]